MLLIDLDTLSWEKSLLKRSLVLKEHQLIQAINSSHLFKLLQWIQIQHLVLSKVMSFMRIRELLSGLDSGKFWLHPPLVLLQCSILLKYMLQMVLHLLTGCQITGIGGEFLNNSKRVQAGTYQDTDIVMIMNIWTFNMVWRDQLLDQPTPST